MISAVAQTQPIPNNIEKNISIHSKLAKIAANKGADLIVFPEMSLSGYERENAANLAFSKNDDRLAPLLEASQNNKIHIVAGGPILIDKKLHIGSFIIKPDNTILIYTKQHLHAGEEKFFVPSKKYNPLLILKEELISFAICADINHPDHAQNAKNNQATLIVASIFYTPNGIPKAKSILSDYSKKHSLKIIMSNFCNSSYNLKAGGSSCYWSKEGEQTGSLDNLSQGLLFVDTLNNSSFTYYL